jgi:hypothetical protein
MNSKVTVTLFDNAASDLESYDCYSRRTWTYLVRKLVFGNMSNLTSNCCTILSMLRHFLALTVGHLEGAAVSMCSLCFNLLEIPHMIKMIGMTIICYGS